MGASFVIALREGIEAALIVSIVLAYLKQVGASDRSRVVWWGAGLAIVLSAALGTVIFVAGAEFEGTAEQVFEGLVTLAAVGVLTWMIFWMRRQVRASSPSCRRRSTRRSSRAASRSRASRSSPSSGRASRPRSSCSPRRRGPRSKARRPRPRGHRCGPRARARRGPRSAAVPRRHPHEPPVLLPRDRVDPVVVAAGLFAYSLHELQEAGWLPILEATAFDLSASLPDDAGLGAILRGLVGYNADPTWLEVVGWLAYLVVVGGLFLQGPVQPGTKSRPEPETSVTSARHAETDTTR